MNKPDDEDRKNTLTEQGWAGFLFLLLWAAAIIFPFVAKTCIQQP